MKCLQLLALACVAQCAGKEQDAAELFREAMEQPDAPEVVDDLAAAATNDAVASRISLSAIASASAADEVDSETFEDDDEPLDIDVDEDQEGASGTETDTPETSVEETDVPGETQEQVALSSTQDYVLVAACSSPVTVR